MTKKMSRILGLVLVLGALIALWFYLPGLTKSRISTSGIALMTTASVKQMALSYLVTGLAAGFGLALLAWSFLKERR